MRLLLDENLSPKLGRMLTDEFEEIRHVRDFGLEESVDSSIWTYAAENDFVIVPKDKDFADRAMVRGAPPKVIWLRLGNCSAQTVAQLLKDSRSILLAFEDDLRSSFCVLPPGLQI